MTASVKVWLVRLSDTMSLVFPVQLSMLHKSNILYSKIPSPSLLLSTTASVEGKI